MLETRELMEEFRGLLNLEVPERKLISFVFFGLPEIEQNLKLDPPLAQRVALRYRLEPFTAESTEAYIKHRLRLAGCPRSPFTPEAIAGHPPALGRHARASSTPSATTRSSRPSWPRETLISGRDNPPHREQPGHLQGAKPAVPVPPKSHQAPWTWRRWIATSKDCASRESAEVHRPPRPEDPARGLSALRGGRCLLPALPLRVGAVVCAGAQAPAQSLGNGRGRSAGVSWNPSSQSVRLFDVSATSLSGGAPIFRAERAEVSILSVGSDLSSPSSWAWCGWTRT